MIDAGAAGTTTANVPPSGSALPPAIPDAESGVKAMRPHLRNCFFDQLQRKQVLTGTITFAIEVGPDGRVASASVETREGLDDACLTCMTRSVKEGRFTPPLDGLPTTVIAPFTFHSASFPGATPSPAGLPSVLVPQPEKKR